MSSKRLAASIAFLGNHTTVVTPDGVMTYDPPAVSVAALTGDMRAVAAELAAKRERPLTWDEALPLYRNALYGGEQPPEEQLELFGFVFLAKWVEERGSLTLYCFVETAGGKFGLKRAVSDDRSGSAMKLNDTIDFVLTEPRVVSMMQRRGEPDYTPVRMSPGVFRELLSLPEVRADAPEGDAGEDEDAQGEETRAND